MTEHGRAQAPVPLSTGALTALFCDGELHDVRVGGTTVLDRVHIVVRDRDWGTVSPRLDSARLTTDEDSFEVTCEVTASCPQVDLTYHATISGQAGTIRFGFVGHARSDFLANRVGFSLLHPQRLAGTSVAVVTADGQELSGADVRFPERISPHQLFPEMTGLSHPVGNTLRFHLRFAGELFETEDQRNWTDASYKTYCSPLRLPHPRRFRAGEAVSQVITLTVTDDDAAPSPATRGPDGRGARRVTRQTRHEAPTVRVGDRVVGTLPVLGLGAHVDGAAVDEPEARLLRATRPSHLLVELDTTADWEQALRRAITDARSLGTPLDVAITSHARGEDLRPILRELGDEGTPLRRLHTYDADTHTTGASLAIRLRRLADEYGISVPLGGGSRAHFAELNRARLPLDQLDFVTYSISPQVHAFDDASIMSTTRAQPATLRDARVIAGGRPLVIGPLTLRPRFNPVATASTALERPEADPRQALPFTAAWTLASVAALHGADALTFYQAVGPHGVVGRAPAPRERPRGVRNAPVAFPVHGLLRALSTFQGAEVLVTEVPEREGTASRLAVLALRDGAAVDVALANLGPEPIQPVVEIRGAAVGRVELLTGDASLEPRHPEIPGYGVALLHASATASPRVRTRANGHSGESQP